jgi:hypothetical protein
MVLPYIQDFLCGPHPYRQGSVCPFVPGAVKRDRIFYAAGIPDATITVQAEHIRRCVTRFLQEKRGFSALVILLPKNMDIDLLLDVHHAVKIHCVRRKLMVGALYRTSGAASIHNQKYFPLRTPVPTIVVRDMVVSDLRFLDPRNFSVIKRLVFLHSFIRKFEPTSRKSTVSVREYEEARVLYRHYLCWVAKRALGAALLASLLGSVIKIRLGGKGP